MINQLYSCIVPSPVGKLYICVDSFGRLKRLEFLNENNQFISHAAKSKGFERTNESAQRCDHVLAQLDGYFAGKRNYFSLELAPEGTEFQERTWAELATIPFGKTCSYGEIARRIGNPKASRAVGIATGRNPISIIIPCHRVIGSNGNLTGYAAGLDRKKMLLALEGTLNQNLLSTKQFAEEQTHS